MFWTSVQCRSEEFIGTSIVLYSFKAWRLIKHRHKIIYNLHKVSDTRSQIKGRGYIYSVGSGNKPVFITGPKLEYIYRSFAATVSQLKISIFSGETFKGFEVLYFSMNVTTTQLLSSGYFHKLRCDTIPVKSASANVSFYTIKSKVPNSEL